MTEAHRQEASVVGCEHDEGVVEHACLVQCGSDVPNPFVQARHHPRHRAALLPDTVWSVRNRVGEAVTVLIRDLVWRVDSLPDEGG